MPLSLVAAVYIGSVQRKLLTPEDVEDVRREIQIMNHLAGHKNVVNIRGSYEDKNFIHIVMEVCGWRPMYLRTAGRAPPHASRLHVTVTHTGLLRWRAVRPHRRSWALLGAACC
jgi:hypothetical protein